jgi:hypothetical protein
LLPEKAICPGKSPRAPRKNLFPPAKALDPEGKGLFLRQEPKNPEQSGKTRSKKSFAARKRFLAGEKALSSSSAAANPLQTA